MGLGHTDNAQGLLYFWLYAQDLPLAVLRESYAVVVLEQELIIYKTNSLIPVVYLWLRL